MVPDCLQRLLQDVCAPLKSGGAHLLAKTRALHGLAILSSRIVDELAVVGEDTGIQTRVARFLLAPKRKKYTKWSQNMQTVRKIDRMS
jgi:hypothetical protein